MIKKVKRILGILVIILILYLLFISVRFFIFESEIPYIAGLFIILSICFGTIATVLWIAWGNKDETSEVIKQIILDITYYEKEKEDGN